MSRMIAICIIIILAEAGFTKLNAQYISYPDSFFVSGSLMIWFQEGALDNDYLGCDSTLTSDSLFLAANDVILSQSLYDELTDLGMESIRRAYPSIRACQDTLSIARSGDTLRMPDFWNAMVVEFDDTGWETSLSNLCAYLLIFFQDEIKYCEPLLIHEQCGSDEPLRKTCYSPNDPLLYLQTANGNSFGTWSGQYGIDIESGWNYNITGSDVLVGVIDDGICAKGPGNQSVGHPDLGAQSTVVVGSACYKPIVTPYYKYAEHGTRIAAIIGALTNDNVGTAGISGGSNNSDNTELVALQVSGTYNAQELSAAIVEGVTSVTNNQWECDILNLSIQQIGSNDYAVHSEQLRGAVTWAYMNDVPVCNAIGNTDREADLYVGNTISPGSTDDERIVVVGLSERNDRGLSVYGEPLDFLAPKSYAAVTRFDANGDPVSHSHLTANTTSFATPVVAGVFSLMNGLVKKSPGNLPDYLAVEDYVQIAAHEASTNINTYGLPIKKHLERGYGIINAEKALELMSSPYEIRHYTVPISYETGSFTKYDNIPIGFPYQAAVNQSYKAPLHNVKQYKITKRLSYPTGVTGSEVVRIWIRGMGTKGFRPMRYKDPNGLSGQYLPLYHGVGWGEVTAYNSSGFDVETYLHEVEDQSNPNNWTWFDGVEPTDVSVEVTIITNPNVSSAQRLIPVADSKIVVFPNTFSSTERIVPTLTAGEGISSNMHISIVDALGRVIAKQYLESIAEGGVQLDVGKLRPGWYFVVCRTHAIIAAQRIHVY